MMSLILTMKDIVSQKIGRTSIILQKFSVLEFHTKVETLIIRSEPEMLFPLMSYDQRDCQYSIFIASVDL